MKKSLMCLVGFISIFVSCTTIEATDKKQKEMNMQDFKEIVKPFYTKCLTVNNDTDISKLMVNLLSDDFQSIGSAEIKNKETLIGQLHFFWKLIPDLKWEIQEMLQDGNKVIVRSIATGSPKGDFMGLPTDGSKSFKIMTIDIHTVENGKIVKVHHLEDWAVAMRQLK
ncbi:MAG: ester cyclase [Desulfamplus sp.]|nr:ester cyclase [Desulfamplus sp.]